MPENKITCIFSEIDTGISTGNQFCCEIERPFTNLNEISTILAGKTYISNLQQEHIVRCGQVVSVEHGTHNSINRTSGYGSNQLR